MNTKRMSTIAMSVLGVAAAAASGQGIEGANQVAEWAGVHASGPIGDAPIVTPALQCDYAFDQTESFSSLQNTTAVYEATAAETKTVSFSYDWRGNHRFFIASAGLQVFAMTSSGPTVIDLVPYASDNVTGDFQFTGRATIDVEAGMAWGIRVRADNADANNNANGSVVLYNFSEFFEGPYDIGQWSASASNSGSLPQINTVGFQDAVELRYDTVMAETFDTPNCNGPGFVNRTPEFFDMLNYACANGTATFNWSYDWFHAFSVDTASISAVSGGAVSLLDERCNVREILTGRTTIPVDTGEQFGLRVGGNNGDSTNFLRGAVVMWNLSFAECIADVQTTNTNPGDAGYGAPDGTVDGADLSYYVEQWLAGCP